MNAQVTIACIAGAILGFALAGIWLPWLRCRRAIAQMRAESQAPTLMIVLEDMGNEVASVEWPHHGVWN